MRDFALEILVKLCRYNFGTFEKEEFKKFLRMGLIFAVILGTYWALRPLKDSVFISLVGANGIPKAKMVSVLALLPLVVSYTKLLEKTSREKMLVLLPMIYGITTLVFSGLLYIFQSAALENRLVADSMFSLLAEVVAYSWYLFIESYGSLAVALFWAFATDTTDPNSAKRGFPLVVALGQIGGIVFPYCIVGLPYLLGHITDTISVLILGFCALSVIPLVRNLITTTPKHLMQSFEAQNLKKQKAEEKHEPGFFEGLKLLLSSKYLLAIFASNCIYEVIITVFDFNFKVAASAQYSGVELSKYLGAYGSSVNIVSLACLLLGISNITNFLGVGAALALMPFFVGIALFSFLATDSLMFLFVIMVSSKAINYALNGPALKQLYIPTSSDVRFKSQAWIETFGSRTAKGLGSTFNQTLKYFQANFGASLGRMRYLKLSGGIGFPLIIFWFIIAMYLGRQFNRAIKEKSVIC